MDSARRVINNAINPHFLSEMVSYDVASTIHIVPGLNPRLLSCVALMI